MILYIACMLVNGVLNHAVDTANDVINLDTWVTNEDDSISVDIDRFNQMGTEDLDELFL